MLTYIINGHAKTIIFQGWALNKLLILVMTKYMNEYIKSQLLYIHAAARMPFSVISIIFIGWSCRLVQTLLTHLNLGSIKQGLSIKKTNYWLIR